MVWRMAVLFIMFSLAWGQTSDRGAPISTSNQRVQKSTELEPSVRRLQEYFLGIVRTSNVNGFLKLVPVTGVFIGTDEPRSSRQVIQRDMDRKQGIYCLLFDSECLSKERSGKTKPQSHICSFRELLAEPNQITIDNTTERHEGEQLTLIDVQIDNYKCSSGQLLLRFVFVRSGTEWKLRAIPYP